MNTGFISACVGAIWTLVLLAVVLPLVGQNDIARLNTPATLGICAALSAVLTFVSCWLMDVARVSVIAKRIVQWTPVVFAGVVVVPLVGAAYGVLAGILAGLTVVSAVAAYDRLGRL